MSGENAHETDGAPPDSSAGRMNSGLAALAQAAALCCREEPLFLPPPPTTPFEQTSRYNKHARDSPPGSSHGASPTHKRTRSIPTLPIPTYAQRGPDLPPIFATSLPASPLTIPPLSTFTSFAGSGCCCGLRCACPGCVEHRGAEHASDDREDCPGCGSCVDYDGGVELPAQPLVTRMTAALPPLDVRYPA